MAYLQHASTRCYIIYVCIDLLQKLTLHLVHERKYSQSTALNDKFIASIFAL